MIDNEEQKNNSIQGKPNKKASLLLPIIVAAVIFVAMVVAIIISERYNLLIKDNEENGYLYKIESVTNEKNQLIISGWFFERGKSTVDLNDQEYFPEMCIALRSQDNALNEMYYLETVSRQPRSDVNEYFSSEYDYTNSGFYATINIDDIENPNGNYEILIIPDVNGTETIKTENYIDNMQWKY